LEQKKKEAQQWLDQIGTHAKENNIPYKSEIIEGPVSVEATIVDYAEREKIDMILMGTRGRSGFTKMLLGSVASKVVTYSPCPVMIVK
jgi:nucleotide-binding universal stress UspA family protein